MTKDEDELTENGNTLILSDFDSEADAIARHEDSDYEEDQLQYADPNMPVFVANFGLPVAAQAADAFPILPCGIVWNDAIAQAAAAAPGGPFQELPPALPLCLIDRVMTKKANEIREEERAQARLARHCEAAWPSSQYDVAIFKGDHYEVGKKWLTRHVHEHQRGTYYSRNYIRHRSRHPICMAYMLTCAIRFVRGPTNWAACQVAAVSGLARSRVGNLVRSAPDGAVHVC